MENILQSKAGMAQIDALLREKEAKYRAFWRMLVEHESPTARQDLVAELCDRIETFARENGFAVRRVKAEQVADFLILSIGEGEQPIGFLAHVDTVHAVGSFPSLWKEEGDRVIGPGISDCKGGIAVAMLAMEVLRDSGSGLSTRLVLVPDEEDNRLTGKVGGEIISQALRGCRVVYCGEPNQPGKAVIARKGAARYYLRVYGKAAHSGSAYDDGVSAIREMAHKILAIEAASDSAHITYNCATVSGGKAANIIPDFCELLIDVRYSDPAALAEAEAHLGRVTAESASGARAELIYRNGRPPLLENEASFALFRRLSEVSVAIGLSPLSPERRGGGADSAYAALLGIPVVCGLGVAGWNAHTKEEYARLSSLYDNARLLTYCSLTLDQL